MSNLGLIERARQMLNAAGRRDAQQYSANQQNTKTPKARSANQMATGNLKPLWMETGASVTSCQRQLHKWNRSHPGGADDAITFTVSFTYYAHARTYYESFTSAESKAPGESFSVYYNAFNPQQNTNSVPDSDKKGGLSAIGIVGYMILSILVLTLARG